MTQWSSPSRHPHALIVEDEVLIARGLEAELKDLGFEACSLAANARQAIPLAVNHTPDIAVIDIYLNGVRDGIETARMLRALCEVPVVFVTAYTDEEGMLDAFGNRCRVLQILSKPLYNHRLADAVAKVAKAAPSCQQHAAAQ
jgi:DNA-binding NarL/FixJ family response regulator